MQNHVWMYFKHENEIFWKKSPKWPNESVSLISFFFLRFLDYLTRIIYNLNKILAYKFCHALLLKLSLYNSNRDHPPYFLAAFNFL